MTRTTRNGCWPNSRSGAWRQTSRLSTCCFPRRKCASSNCLSPQNSPPNCRSRCWPSIPPPTSRPNSFPPTTPTRQMATLPRRWCTSTTAPRMTTSNWRAWGCQSRAQLPSRAMEIHGAVGCLIYSDPADDGYAQGDGFPNGAWRPRDGVQRGSVMDMPLYPGDPLTPGVGATKDAKRLDLKDVKTITRIPVLPISYADAQPLLAALKGEVAPEAWRGSLAQTYHVGPAPAKVHLKVQSNWDIKPLYDVIVRIPGSTNPDEWVVRGNHHDAWVNGAEDPISGTVALMEEARGLATLLKQGWKPGRTIIYCVWDGEEPALLGST